MLYYEHFKGTKNRFKEKLFIIKKGNKTELDEWIWRSDDSWSTNILHFPSLSFSLLEIEYISCFPCSHTFCYRKREKRRHDLSLILISMATYNLSQTLYVDCCCIYYSYWEVLETRLLFVFVSGFARNLLFFWLSRKAVGEGESKKDERRWKKLVK